MLEIPLHKTWFKKRAKKITFKVYYGQRDPKIEKKVFLNIKKITEYRGPRIRRFIMRDNNRRKKIFIHCGTLPLSVIIE